MLFVVTGIAFTLGVFGGFILSAIFSVNAKDRELEEAYIAGKNAEKKRIIEAIKRVHGIDLTYPDKSDAE